MQAVMQKSIGDAQKTFLEQNGWTCKWCSGCRKWDCLNNSFKGYLITLKSGIAKISLKGRIVASAPAHELRKKMQEQNILSPFS